MGHLDVNLADLLKTADSYAELATRTAAIAPKVAMEIERVMSTHGAMGYPAASGIATGVAARQTPVVAKAADFVGHSTRFVEHSATYQSEDRAAAGRISAVDFKQAPPQFPPQDPAPKPPPEPKKPQDEGKKGGTKKSMGKKAKGRITPEGELEQQWGHPTDMHEAKPDVPGKTGTFDGDHGSWEWHGPGSQGQAHAEKYSDGRTAQANADAWAVKGEANWSRDVFGHPLDANVNGQIGTHNDAHATVTDHGISFGAESFTGGEIGGKVDYDFGPVDLSLGGAAQLGGGGSAGLDFGMQDGKFVVGANLGLAVGPGAKIAPSIAVDPKWVMDGLTKAGDFLSGIFG